ncbi:hypothetical protein HRR83_007181 [Exophiala dermatitidis]|uniref:Uncharacterized protein n=1 Tax=Exophiala dermatitidis TaxID=5970 RepID=A0AAN6IT43_EXODE|nr:hypothetical protein HRR73_006473 [Exophiala dermatitidis]KAJ4511925.1 hypothetical protein HRR74_006659 [Exophiala dermatitidis]KAJ4534786.1 hypothetical protein HRR76_006695 [Exophiala dermatitidis]KAJ4550864.1 hypothetical protein HRR77_003222 [Exophiala dermatitidis]KAJ4562011.1 hypothetical protein HRR79_006874 [Exophiala dermatitidis]
MPNLLMGSTMGLDKGRAHVLGFHDCPWHPELPVSVDRQARAFPEHLLTLLLAVLLDVSIMSTRFSAKLTATFLAAIGDRLRIPRGNRPLILQGPDERKHSPSRSPESKPGASQAYSNMNMQSHASFFSLV